MHCKMFGSIPDLYPLDASSRLSVVKTKVFLDIAQMSSRKRNHHWLRTTAFEDSIHMSLKAPSRCCSCRAGWEGNPDAAPSPITWSKGVMKGKERRDMAGR